MTTDNSEIPPGRIKKCQCSLLERPLYLYCIRVRVHDLVIVETHARHYII